MAGAAGTTRNEQIVEWAQGAERRRRRGPGEALSPQYRHDLAVRQSLRWAQTAAAEGDYEEALSWLATVEAVDGALPDGWERRRAEWRQRRR